MTPCARLSRLVWVLALLSFLLVAVPANSQAPREPIAGIERPEFQRTGQTGFQFLHLPTTARNAALAGIQVINRDVTAAFNNPANLVWIENFDLSLTNISYIADIQYNTGAIAKNFGRWGVVGIRVASLDAGDMYRTENVFDEDKQTTVRSTGLGTFTAGDLLVGLSYARLITDRLSVGGNISYIRESLADTEVDNFGLDFGIFFETGFRSLRLSMVAKNIGPDAEYVGFTSLYGVPQSVRMPIDFRLGVAYDFIEADQAAKSQLSGYLEAVHPNDGPERIHAAVEYSLLDMFAARVGYRANYDVQGLTAGAGINFSTLNFNGRADYAYVDYGVLTASHIITLGIGF